MCPFQRAFDCFEEELQVVMTCQSRVLGSKLWCSVTAIASLECWVNSKMVNSSFCNLFDFVKSPYNWKEYGYHYLKPILLGLTTYLGLLSLFWWQLWNTFWITSRSYRNMLLPLNILYLILMGCESGFSSEAEPIAQINNKRKFISLACQCDLYSAIMIVFISQKRKSR